MIYSCELSPGKVAPNKTLNWIGKSETPPKVVVMDYILFVAMGENKWKATCRHSAGKAARVKRVCGGEAANKEVEK